MALHQSTSLLTLPPLGSTDAVPDVPAAARTPSTVWASAWVLVPASLPSVMVTVEVVESAALVPCSAWVNAELGDACVMLG